MGSRLSGSPPDPNCKPRGCEHSCRSSKIPLLVPALENGFRGGHPGSTVEGGAGEAEKSFQLKFVKFEVKTIKLNQSIWGALFHFAY